MTVREFFDISVSDEFLICVYYLQEDNYVPFKSLEKALNWLSIYITTLKMHNCENYFALSSEEQEQFVMDTYNEIYCQLKAKNFFCYEEEQYRYIITKDNKWIRTKLRVYK